MAIMNISLPDPLKEFVENQAAEEGFGSVSEYLVAVLRDVQQRKVKQTLEAKLRESILSGPATPMTREDWDDLERRVGDRHHQGPSPS